jgi:hypothetical protein
MTSSAPKAAATCAIDWSPFSVMKLMSAPLAIASSTLATSSFLMALSMEALAFATFSAAFSSSDFFGSFFCGMGPDLRAAARARPRQKPQREEKPLRCAIRSSLPTEKMTLSQAAPLATKRGSEKFPSNQVICPVGSSYRFVSSALRQRQSDKSR